MRLVVLVWSYKYTIYSRFSPVMCSKLKIVTIQWKKSRIWDTIDDGHINNLAKNQVSAVFHSCVICWSVSPKFTELCMETPCLYPSEGHKHGGHKVTETSVTEFCYWNEKLLLWSSDTLKEIFLILQALFSYQKLKSITHPSTYTTALSGRNVHVTQRKSLEIQTCSITIRTLSSWNVVKRQVPVPVFHLMKLKLEKER